MNQTGVMQIDPGSSFHHKDVIANQCKHLKEIYIYIATQENDTSCLREHLKIGEPGLAIKSPS